MERIPLVEVADGARCMTPRGIEIERVGGGSRAGRVVVRYRPAGESNYREIEVPGDMLVTPLHGHRARDPLPPAFGIEADTADTPASEAIEERDLTPDALAEASLARLESMEVALDTTRRKGWQTGGVDRRVVVGLQAVRAELRRRRRSSPVEPPAPEPVQDASSAPEPVPPEPAGAPEQLALVPEPAVGRRCVLELTPGIVLQGERWGVQYTIEVLGDDGAVRANGAEYRSVRAALLALTGRNKLNMSVREWLRLSEKP